jgi:hypothetical protein
MADAKPKTPFDDLTEEQRARLRKLVSEVVFDKITVSFSIEERDITGRKRSAFYSVNTIRAAEDGSPGWTLDEVRLAKAVVSRHVVASTYEDAFRRRVLSFSEENRTERDAVVGGYDKLIAGLVSGVNRGSGDPPEGEPTT